MSQKKIKLISTTTYRKIILNKSMYWQQNFSDTPINRKEFDVWENIYKILPPEEQQNVSFRFGFSPYANGFKNHPLVEKGIAFWLNKKTLITGYTLKNNPKIYKPIFQSWKERLNFELRDDIKKYVKFLVAEKREILYKKTLMVIPELNILPESIINMIARFTYDPYLNL